MFTVRNASMTTRRTQLKKVLLVALVGVPWIPLAMALYAFIR
jgi:hypothetical protein